MRLFVGIELPAAVRDAVGREVQDVLRPAFPRAKCVRPDGLHVTLRFLGDQSPEFAEQLAERLGTIAAETPPLFLELGGVGGFPTLLRPRVVWLGVASPALAPLRERVEDACRRTGAPPEERPFHPHLTLARLRDDDTQRARPALAHAAEGLSFEASTTTHSLHLMQSELTPQGARYSAFAVLPLGGR